MRAGELDRKITVERAMAVTSGTGEVTHTWATFATIWARRVPIKADEYFTAQQVNAPVDARFQIRWRDGLDSAMRLVYDGKTYDILSIQEIGRREGYDILARVHR